MQASRESSMKEARAPYTMVRNRLHEVRRERVSQNVGTPLEGVNQYQSEKEANKMVAARVPRPRITLTNEDWGR